jgi:hypothetical protein
MKKRLLFIVLSLFLLAGTANAFQVVQGKRNINNFYYGVTWDEGQSSPVCVRTGTLKGVAASSKPDDTLIPIQANMKRCVLADDGTVAYYLCSTDSTLKADCSTPAVLDGTDGQVMVEIPLFYVRYRYGGKTHVWEISEYPLGGFVGHPAFYKDGAWVNYRYMSAYEGVLYDTSASRYANGIYISAANGVFEEDDDSITLSAPTNAFTNLEAGDKVTVSGTTSNNGTYTVATVADAVITVSEALTDETDTEFVIGTQTDFTATTGDVLGSVTGKSPAVYGVRAQFRAVAANRGTGWSQQDYDLTSAIQLLYLVEYASFYSQSVIGAGITAVTDWPACNDYNPIAKTGNSNSVGNVTGNTGGSTSSATESTKYLSYRGIENFFGHLWKWVDGFNINDNIPYVSNNRTHFADDTATNYTRIEDSAGSGITLINANGYQTSLEQTMRGFLPSAVGGALNTYVTDYYYQSTGWRVAILGGSANYGATAGFFFWGLDVSSGSAGRSIAARVCY